ncbi:GSCOCG00012170001-RA-CDS [Cotesia congregata]|nr:GSCOCG00012170001-RA-CDS [Cotesia congregata]
MACQFVDLFNVSLVTSEFPQNWKDSFVLPIPKVRSPQNFCEYRSISILSSSSKVLERCVYDQLIKYFTSNNIRSSSNWISRRFKYSDCHYSCIL